MMTLLNDCIAHNGLFNFKITSSEPSPVIPFPNSAIGSSNVTNISRITGLDVIAKMRNLRLTFMECSNVTRSCKFVRFRYHYAFTYSLEEWKWKWHPFWLFTVKVCDTNFVNIFLRAIILQCFVVPDITFLTDPNWHWSNMIEMTQEALLQIRNSNNRPFCN